MAWSIHTGPFPIVTPSFAGEIWLWRITDGTHYTAVTVKLAQHVLDADVADLAAATREAIRSRGGSEVRRSLVWDEPPREVTFDSGASAPQYWGGHRVRPRIADDAAVTDF